jgi:hypothetical protein
VEPIIVLIVICILGFIKMLFSMKSSNDERSYAISFLNKYREFCKELINDSDSDEIYEWLKLNSAKMQKQMGEYGIASSYKPSMSDLIYKNYQIIVNGIGNIYNLKIILGNFHTRSDLENKMLYTEIKGIDDTLLTYIGALDSEIEDETKEIKNPINWFSVGVRTIVTLPILLTYKFGIIQYQTFNKFENNFFVKFITFLIAMIGLVSSIITIVTGYSPFTNIINKWI